MVVCNMERFVAESIESILNQTFPDFEFIIVDFGSTDRSKPIPAQGGSKYLLMQQHQKTRVVVNHAINLNAFPREAEMP